MLSYIELKNFKSLTDVKIDLRGENKKPKKMIFIYGENGAGKTNLISSILFLEKSLLTLSNNIKLRKIYDKNVPELLSDIENDEIKVVPIGKGNFELEFFINELKKYTIDIDILLENSTVEIAKECINSIKKYI